MRGVAEDIERRLAGAAEAVREYELATHRATILDHQLAELSARLDESRAQYAAEQADVERLERLSLTSVLAALRGARDDELARERAEADAAHYRAREARARLDQLRREYEAAQARLGQLAEAPATYSAVLDQKERWLAESGDPRGAQLLALADERGRLAGELREIREALGAARLAREALGQVEERLGSASSWSTYDTFFGGGAISSAIKHTRLDDAAEAAAHADRCLAVLRTELADIGGTGLTAPQLAMDGTTRFLDVWFDNIFTDLTVRDQIKQAQANVARSIQLVTTVYGRLERRAAQTRARLDGIDKQRHSLLTGQ
jgi:hypothetical protein